MAYDERIAERLRQVLSRRADVTEKRMVGGRSFIVGGHLCCGVTGKALMVRVGPAAYGAALAEPHVRPMKLGGRSLLGYVCVDPPGIANDQDLGRWVRLGVDFVATL
jgi:TfoX N-terminal domain